MSAAVAALMPRAKIAAVETKSFLMIHLFKKISKPDEASIPNQHRTVPLVVDANTRQAAVCVEIELGLEWGICDGHAEVRHDRAGAEVVIEILALGAKSAADARLTPTRALATIVDVRSFTVSIVAPIRTKFLGCIDTNCST